jgi:hypothetical protein
MLNKKTVVKDLTIYSISIKKKNELGSFLFGY